MKNKAKPRALDLGEIAVQLMQAQPSETESLQDLCEALGRCVEGELGADSSPSVKRLVTAAKAKLDSLLSGEAADAEQALAAAVRLTCLATSPDESPRNSEPDLEWESEEVAPVAAAVSEVPSLPPGKPTLVPADPDLDLIGEFMTEANEHVVNAEAALLTLEERPDDAAAVNTVFRAFHTVKGVSSMLGMTALAELAHHAESLLARIRDGEIQCTGVYANLCLRGIDLLKETLNAVSAQLHGQEAQLPAGYAQLVRELQNPDAAGAEATSAVAPAPTAAVPLPAPVAAAAAAEPAVAAAPVAAAAPAAPKAAAAARSAQAAAPSAQAPLAAPPSAASAPVASRPAAPSEAEAPARAAAQGDETSVRVRTDRLDRLIDMVGELVIAHSMLAADPRNDVSRDPDLSRKVGHAGKIVRELQDMSMSLRMVPLRPTFQKLTRIVRDVAKKSDKLIQFVSTGDDTEIDRNMVDVIAEPLIHMVRNAADHGIESTAARIAAGKSATGTVRLAAYHSGGNVVIDLSDDGGGLDRDRILAKAAQKGLIDPNKSLSESEIYQLIFLPGFSTTENVTDISGRGVGMDVVRRNIEQLKGRIEITSERGKGTVFSIRLPLTLAITDGMIVRVGSERYIIPTVNIAMN
ncbi:MAG TPA: chemotaxis protein CheA, partial [Polyangiaceae bacterium]|nr:chemotaxis protein CheA [Polyangiaceae bacterium]